MANSLAGQPRLLGRMLGVLPDLLTGIACVIVWVSPLTFGQGAVKTVVLMMLMEFLIVHGTGFFTAIAFAEGTTPRRQLGAMACMLGFYALFVGAFAWSFKAWWPVWVFTWLVASKAAWIFSSTRERAIEANPQTQAWAFSTVAYLAAVGLTLFLPVPELGITASIRPELGLSGSGEWIDHPHVAVAAMAFYYFAIAWFKWWTSRGVPAD